MKQGISSPTVVPDSLESSNVYRYGGALLFTLAAALIRLVLVRWTGAGSPFVLFFGATLASAYAFGRGPGFTSGIFGTALGTWLFIPTGLFHAGQIMAQSALFLIEAIMVTHITDAFNRSRKLTNLQAHALAHSEAHYRVLTEVSPQGTWEANVVGAITYTNDYWQRYANLSAGQSIGDGWLVALKPAERRRAKAFMRLCIFKGRSFETKIQLLRGTDATYRWHLVCGRPVWDEHQVVRKWVGVAVDIHEQKQAEADLATAVRARDNFLSTASHELKTPLTSMQLMTQMMRRNHERGQANAYSPQKLTRLFVQIDKSVRRLTRIIDDMLDVSRISTGKLTFNFERTDLRQLVGDVMERLSGQIEASGVPVTVSCTHGVLGNWDKMRLEQVITNLVINAIRYGEGAPIEIVARPTGQSVCLSVRDYGPGVAPNLQKLIFQQFERGSTHNSSGGLGLGLYLCRQIVERHGGEIGCTSPSGPGAQFVVSLPYISAPARA
jgi:PAS domain S-box-containing protein